MGLVGPDIEMVRGAHPTHCVFFFGCMVYFSFPRSRVGMHMIDRELNEVWVPTEDSGNQAVGRNNHRALRRMNWGNGVMPFGYCTLLRFTQYNHNK